MNKRQRKKKTKKLLKRAYLTIFVNPLGFPLLDEYMQLFHRETPTKEEVIKWNI